MKRVTRLTESDFHNIIKDSIKKVLNENSYRKATKKKVYESSKYEGLSFKDKVEEIISDALYNAFGEDFINGTGNGWVVDNPDNENEYVCLTFGY